MRRDPRPRLAGGWPVSCWPSRCWRRARARYAAPDARELKAREHFVAGRYQEALDLFAKLYAESLHPNYLRNIGRCYQNLGQPDRAIVSFHDYLRKAKVSPEERVEIEGFIKEMEELKRQQQEPAASQRRRRSTTAAAPRADHAAPAARRPPTRRPPAKRRRSWRATRRAPAESAPPVYTRWWFWTLVGAGAVALAARRRRRGRRVHDDRRRVLPAGRRCP